MAYKLPEDSPYCKIFCQLNHITSFMNRLLSVTKCGFVHVSSESPFSQSLLEFNTGCWLSSLATAASDYYKTKYIIISFKKLIKVSIFIRMCASMLEYSMNDWYVKEVKLKSCSKFDNWWQLIIIDYDWWQLIIIDYDWWQLVMMGNDW